MKDKTQKDIKDRVIKTQGTIKEVLPAALEYIVEIDFNTGAEVIKHLVKCKMSGRMKKNFIKVDKGDLVDIRISLYNIDEGVITYVYRNRGVESTEVTV